MLRLLEDNPQLNQRELASRLDVSLGKVNYVMKSLLDKGWIKARNFKNSKNKLAYAYVLTPEGIEQKARLTYQFLQRKMMEYEELKKEIEDLQMELNK